MNGRTATKPSEISIKRAKSKGFIIRHSFDNAGAGEAYRMPEEHIAADDKGVMAHLKKHFGMGDDESAEPLRAEDTDPRSTRKAPSIKTKGAGVD